MCFGICLHQLELLPSLGILQHLLLGMERRNAKLEQARTFADVLAAKPNMFLWRTLQASQPWAHDQSLSRCSYIQGHANTTCPGPVNLNFAVEASSNEAKLSKAWQTVLFSSFPACSPRRQESHYLGKHSVEGTYFAIVIISFSILHLLACLFVLQCFVHLGELTHCSMLCLVLEMNSQSIPARLIKRFKKDAFAINPSLALSISLPQCDLFGHIWAIRISAQLHWLNLKSNKFEDAKRKDFVRALIFSTMFPNCSATGKWHVRLLQTIKQNEVTCTFVGYKASKYKVETMSVVSSTRKLIGYS